MTRLKLVLFAAALPALLPSAAAQPAPIKAHTALVHGLAVSPDGKTVATAGFDNSIKLWEIAPDGTLKEKKELKGHTGPVTRSRSTRRTRFLSREARTKLRRSGTSPTARRRPSSRATPPWWTRSRSRRTARPSPAAPPTRP